MAMWQGLYYNGNKVMYRNQNASKGILYTYDFIIFGSRIHSGKIDGLKKMKELLSGNENTQLVVFATGGTPIEADRSEGNRLLMR